MIVMVFRSVYSLSVDQFFEMVPIKQSRLRDLIDLHSLVVVFPSFAEDVALLSQLSVKIIGKVLKSVLEFFLKLVQSIVNVVHCLNSLFFVLRNFTVNIKVR